MNFAKIRSGDLPFLRHFTLVSFLSVTILSFSVLEFGFDNSVMGLVQAMDSFDKDFGMYQGKSHKLGAVKLSLLGSVGTPFKALMMIAALFVGERYGRWVVFVVMQLGSVAGATVLYTARSFLQVLVGRVVLSSFSGWHDWLIPMYLAEIVPGPVRGAVIACYMVFSYGGSFSASIATFLCSREYSNSDPRQYRIPFALMWMSPLLCLALCWVLPESPRWLVRKGRMEDAVRALRRLNGSKPGYSPEEEAKLLRESIENDTVTQGHWRDLFKGTNKRRTLTTLLCIFFVQFTGQAFVSRYGTIFVKNLRAMDPMEFGLLERGLGVVGPLTLIFVVDRLGRRRVYLVGATLYTCCLCLIGGIGTMPMDRVREAVITLFILSAILHTIAFHGVGMIVSAEVPHLRLRDKTLTLSYVISFACEFGVSFSLPYLLLPPANLESKVGFIYGAIALAGIVWAWFCLPETSGRSLEEMEELWAEGVPAYRFAQYTTHGGVGLRISQLERHAGAAAGNSSVSERSEEDIKGSGVEVVHEEVVVVPEKV